jgi:hypothetical protein
MAAPHRVAIGIVTLAVRGKPAKTTSDNRKRVKLLQAALLALADRRDWLPIDAVVLPAGYVRVAGGAGTRSRAARVRRLRAEPATRAAIECCATLTALSPGTLLIFGADSSASPRKRRYDQWAIVCDDTSLVAVARKIFPTEGDTARGFVPSTADYGAPGRVITLASGKRALLCVCYDLFGVTETPDKPGVRTQMISRMIEQGREVDRRQRRFPETRRASVTVWQRLVHTRQPEIAIALVHKFRRPGLDGYWQRHAIATAAAALGGAAIAAAHFTKRLPHHHEAPLASFGVPATHLAAGGHRRAWRHVPADEWPVTLGRRVAAVLRLYRFVE